MLTSKLKIALLYIIITAISFVCVEFLVRVVTHFPTLGFGKSYHIYPNDKTPNAPLYENEFLPHASYYSLEGGYHVYRKNNLGLQGTDVVINDNSKYIYVMGNSYVEARATAPKEMSTSVFQELLSKHISKDFQVINIGLGGQIPFEGWCRLIHWSKKIKPDYVILIINDGTVTNMLNAKSESYVLPDNFDQETHDWKFDIVKLICNKSSLVNLVRVSFRKPGIVKGSTKAEKIYYRPYSSLEFNQEAYLILLSNLHEMHRQYGDRFLCLSIMSDKWNKIIDVDCRKAGINFGYDGSISYDGRYFITGGHFNTLGNQVLGLDLFKTFKQ